MRYDQCDDTCTTDCGHCKGAGKPVAGIVCLCGSTRFRAEFVEANRDQTMDGRIVLAPGVFAHDGDPLTEQEKERLDSLHLRKIDMADYVYVVNPGGYIGDSTRREIAYARSTGKPVTWLIPITA